ncbi:transglycosylase domain-containing protein [Agrococcus jejuensis]|uniref:Membrane carboxypeptidase (Penicillin-binding protein) n=1 Tax=Agrococcus jejuensis TaxID=399736 RepID=A0A1G8FC27_9MICO|nr:transglycosylase domain-containing protein [Agrococcus jejuensis]SDH79708.1 Membrane carboxypeptidase (penicillin-binding protein) [Agrococcus jejuensis]
MSPRSSVRHAPGSFLGSLVGLVGFSVVVGLLVSATVVPGVAVASSTANSGIDVFESLPDFVQIDEQSEVSTIYGRDAAQQPVPIAQFYSQNRQIVSLADAGRWAPLAAIAGEDARFYEHGGVDVISVVRALSPGGDGGASSLTMQLVRQQIVEVACAIVDPATGARQDEELCANQTTDSYGRKLQEMRFAIGLEQRYTKNEILAAYLNIANYGDATYGIQAAAQRYFSVNANQLTIAQAASLLATVQYPTNLNLSQPANYAANQERRDYVIQRMHTVGYITDAQRDEALAIPVDDAFVQPRELQSGCMASYYGSTGFFCDYVTQLLRNPQPDGSYILGADRDAAQRTLALGGLQISTSIDVTLNEAVQVSLDANVPLTETRLQYGGAVTQLEVSTGRILAMAQNRDYDNTESFDPATETGVNYNVDRAYGGGEGFQPGSGYKIFTLAAWIEAGYSVNTSLDTRRMPRDVLTCEGARQEYDPNNNEGFSSARQNVVGIFVNSMNTGVTEMGTRVSVCQVQDAATRMGTTPANQDAYDTHYPSWFIGTGGTVTPMAMANAFQTIANGGVHCAPRAIDGIVARDGTEIAVPPLDCEQALTPEVASVMQFVLQEVTNRNPKNNPAGTAPVISKTGTSDAVRQTWVNGASSTVATSVWIGNIVGEVNIFELGGRAMWDRRSVVFTDVMEAALARYPGGAFQTPDAATLRGNAVPLPNVAGQTPDEARATLEGAGFTVVVGSTVAGAQEAGRIEYSSPGADALVLPQTSVTLLVSDGSLFTPPEAAIPSLEGMTLDAAGAAMGAAGFDAANLQVTWARADPASRCIVLDQNPDSGTGGPPTSPVSIVVGSDRDGPDPTC